MSDSPPFPDVDFTLLELWQSYEAYGSALEC